MKRPPGYEEYIRSTKWRNICKDLKKRAKNVCQHCGHSSLSLAVHHKTYERFGNERMSDLEVLCKTCHEAADEKRAKEARARGETALEEARYDGFMRTVYGEDHHEHDSEENRERFERWRDEKESSGYDE